MLAGRYPSDEFAELRPRIVWDRSAGTVRGRDGARSLAVQNAGTIPDRGLFAVVLPDGARVGELDEEMVYEARSGQTFMLGASTWRIEEITRDRVIVTPAPGAPGALPFWKGEGVGRPFELGEAVGRLARELVAAGPEPAGDRLRDESAFEERAAGNLVAYLEDQAAATGVVPSDRAIVIERFRDEIGDWRLCVLTPFGARVHAPWALALAARLRASSGQEAHAIWGDDGIAVHLPDADEAPSADVALIAPDELEELILGELGGTALFGARFRENAARALLIPRRRPGRRTPLWQQRLKASSLLQVARRYGSFPVILETYREVPQRLVRPAGPARADGADRVARGRGGRGRDARRLALRRLAAVRVRGLVHVRGRHARRRAARAGAVAEPRPAARAAGPGGAARPDRPGGARRRRGRPPGALGARAGARAGRPPRPAAPHRRPDRRRGGPAPGRARSRRRDHAGAGRRAPRRLDPPRRRASPDRRRGRRPLPRRPRRDAAQRRARRVPRAGARRAALPRGALRPQPRAVPFGRPRRPLRARAAGRRAAARGPRGRRGGGARRAAARRGRAGVVRRRGGAAPAPGEPGGAAARDRAGRPARARALPARLAAGQPAGRGARRGRPARRPRRAPGAGPAARPVGDGGASAPAGRLRAGAARRAGGAGRDRLGRRGRRRRRRRTGGHLLPRGRAAAGPAASRRPARRTGGRRPARGARRRGELLGRPGRRGGRGRARGGLRGAVGAGLGGGGHERPLAAAAGAAPPAAGPAALGRRAPPPGRGGAGRALGRRRALVAVRGPLPGRAARGASAAAPWPS